MERIVVSDACSPGVVSDQVPACIRANDPKRQHLSLRCRLGSLDAIGAVWHKGYEYSPFLWCVFVYVKTKDITCGQECGVLFGQAK